ncbi:3-phosphoshikimate 1-carboxyvinyltransferase [Vagococcus lutrae]|uniref:3-phosphoshikimate 1-carboxyvinyltransferase n=1 Tax=Vagococcus lutrae TaxID=81947 RepID=UPI0020977FDF|nr:3-phosphoshikimate 1-carboxyvinyltransferase [Vagococcus lutrae]MCO7151374.1 3-phosphoshikimate 1-carboxyvinyltransferase [Vagococcus lutrae]MDT2818405.1 3-phosphoshikimate 1-carboxyvinyltransferase [Vagococcus lutrae]MDT2843531.1 3-phosphoshikimate 1-carboxyvinyltransferase [Vagococcus lutrae]WCG05147.1 3-phosphoshikimate 1-carboxyvinyltransferase [Vagococcus lutrae]
MTDSKFSKRIKGTIRVPGDKSISHRALLLGAMAEGCTEIEGLLMAEDVQSSIHLCRSLGVEVTQSEKITWVKSKGYKKFQTVKAPIDVGNSGTTMRLGWGMLAGQAKDYTLTGDESLNNRPMARVLEPLSSMGIGWKSLAKQGCAPITLKGVDTLRPLFYRMPIPSAQVKSALILAALQADGLSVIEEPIASRNHTEEMLPLFGGCLKVADKQIRIEGPQSLKGTTLNIPGDFSSAAFFIVASLILPGSELILRQIGLNPTRTGLLTVIEKMGGTYQIVDEEVGMGTLKVRHTRLTGTIIKGELIPTLIDEIPIIALMATQAHGETIIADASELKVKETNRIDATVTMLQRLGANIISTEDGMIVKGPTSLHGGVVSSCGDHRIGMMLAVAQLLTSESIEIEEKEAINISYPDFLNDLDNVTEVLT